MGDGAALAAGRARLASARARATTLSMLARVVSSLSFCLVGALLGGPATLTHAQAPAPTWEVAGAAGAEASVAPAFTWHGFALL